MYPNSGIQPKRKLFAELPLKCVNTVSLCLCLSIVSHVSHWISPHYYVCTCPVQHLHMLSRGDSLISMSAHAQTLWQRQRIFGKDKEK